MAQNTWTKEPVGYSVRYGHNKRAVIVPQPPRKWNNYCAWCVDALGLDKPVHVKTLAEARKVAFANV